MSERENVPPASVGAPTRVPRVAVGAVVIDQRRDGPYVLLVRRANPPNAGSWTLPGGRLEVGERIVDAVRREVREETGLEVKVGALLEAVEIIEPEFHYVVLDYACEPAGGTLRAGDDAADARMVPAFDLAEYAVTPAVRRVVSRALTDERE